MKYQQITSPERYIISHLRKQGFNPAQIADQLGRHRSTIGRELARNSCWRTDGAYRPSKASERTNGRRSRSRRNQHYSEKDYAIVRRLLRRRWSPEQITGHLKRHQQRAFSHETLYRYIWTDQAAGWPTNGTSRKDRPAWRAAGTKAIGKSIPSWAKVHPLYRDPGRAKDGIRGHRSAQ